MTKYRLDADGAWANRAVVGWHIAPADELLALFLDDPRDQVLNGLAVLGGLRQKHQADTVFASRRQRSWRDLTQKGVRQLDQNTGAIAGVDLAAAGAAML